MTDFDRFDSAFRKIATHAISDAKLVARSNAAWEVVVRRSALFRAHAETTCRVIRELEGEDVVDRAFLNGVALGTMVGLQMALDYPDRPIYVRKERKRG